MADVCRLQDSEDFERSWLEVHADMGAVTLGGWYRPLQSGELGSILALGHKLESNIGDCHGTVLVGDLNVHNEAWLTWSRSTSLALARASRVSSIHGRNVADPYSSIRWEIVRNSILGYVCIYNRLPQRIVVAGLTKSSGGIGAFGNRCRCAWWSRLA